MADQMLQLQIPWLCNRFTWNKRTLHLSQAYAMTNMQKGGGGDAQVWRADFGPMRAEKGEEESAWCVVGGNGGIGREP